MEEGLAVMDPETMTRVPADGETMGEIMFRGNITMKGYLKNPKATQAAFAGGWFHSGDLAVMHPDGYVKIKDRSKDIIISGGENISSLEVEDVLYRHPAVLAAAVVAKPDDKWGETPCAFVELKPGAVVTEAEIIAHLPRPPGEVQGPAARWCSASCPRPPPARSRSSCCARRRSPPASTPERLCDLYERSSPTRAAFRAARGPRRRLHADAEPAAADESLTAQMLAALQENLDRIAGDSSVRVVILAAAGKGFCAGHDLKEIRELREQPKIAELFSQCSRMMQTITALPQPVIARVQGAAAAAGCQLVAQCDLAVASEAAKFATSGVNWGFFCSTPGVAVARNLLRKHAMEMLLTGELVDAQTALEWGLVNRVVPPEKLESATLELARQIAEKPPATVAAGKRAFYQQMDLGVAKAYDLASQVIAASFAHEEGRCRHGRVHRQASSRRKTRRRSGLADDIILETRGLTKEFKGFVAVKDVASKCGAARSTR